MYEMLIQFLIFFRNIYFVLLKLSGDLYQMTPNTDTVAQSVICKLCSNEGKQEENKDHTIQKYV
jgi:hypothetical protein